MKGLVLGIVIIFFLVLIFVIFYIVNRESSDVEGFNVFEWTQPQAINPCYKYEFPIQTISGVNVPMNPTSDKNVLESLQQEEVPDCLYFNQEVYSYTNSTCVKVSSGSSGELNFCTLPNGQKASEGDKIEYYSSQVCPNLPLCTGKISLISINFHPNTNATYCISRSTLQGNFSQMLICDSSDDSQTMIYEELENDGSIPKIMVPIKIYHKSSGQCLVPSTNSINALYNTSYLGDTGCPDFSQTGNELQFSTCLDSIQWAVMPSVAYVGSYTPNQLVYVGNIDFTGAPQNGGDLFSWMVQRSVKSLFWGASGDLILGNLGQRSSCEGNGYVFQHIDWQGYSVAKFTPVCINSQSTACISVLR